MKTVSPEPASVNALLPPPIAPLTVNALGELLSQVCEVLSVSGAEMVSAAAAGSMAMPYWPPSNVLVPISVSETAEPVLLMVKGTLPLSHRPPRLEETVSTEVPE